MQNRYTFFFVVVQTLAQCSNYCKLDNGTFIQCDPGTVLEQVHMQSIKLVARTLNEFARKEMCKYL